MTTRIRAAILFVTLTGLHSVAQGQSTSPVASIRSIDFRNFTYRPSCISRPVPVKSGEYNDQKTDVPVYFAVSDIVFGDLRGDGSEQAVVLTDCNLGGTGMFTETLVFELRAGKPTLITRFQGGDRAIGGIESIRIDGHLLKIAQRWGIAACCANYIATSSYQLRGDELVGIGKPVRDAAPGNASIRQLQFERGADSEMLSGEIAAENLLYSLRARAGQVLEAEPVGNVDSQADVNLAIMDPDGIKLEKQRTGNVSRIKLPESGTYILVIYSSQADVPYAFRIRIQ